MEKLKAAVMAVCVISAVKCIVGNIAAASRMKGQVTVLMDLMLAVVLIAPIAGGIRDFSLPEISPFDPAELGYSEEYYRTALAAQTEKNVEDILMEQITAAGFDCSKISAEVNISEDYGISITKVTVTSEDFEEAAAMIRNSLGTETEVVRDVG